MTRHLAWLFPFGKKTLEEAFLKEFDITVEKTESASLGLRLSSEGGSTLTVKALNAGLVDDWNRKNPARQVELGDRIVEVNEVKGDAEKLIEACKKDGVMKLKMNRTGWYLRIYPALFGVVAAVAVLAAAAWFAHRPGRPESLICGPDGGCPEPNWDARASYWAQLMADIQETSLPLWKWLEHKAGAGLKPAVAHVGPMILAAPPELQLYTLLKRWSPYIAFAEPNPPVVQALSEELPFKGFNRRDYTIVKAALCGTDEKKVPFYVLPPRFFQKHSKFRPVPFSMFSSLNESFVRQNFKNVFHNFWNDYTEEEWKAFEKEYVEPIGVRCVTAASFLREARMAPADVDVLIVDAPSYDLELVLMFLALPGLHPAYLRFHWIDNWSRKTAALTRTVQDLSKRNYTVYQDGADVVAVYTPTR